MKTDGHQRRGRRLFLGMLVGFAVFLGFGGPEIYRFVTSRRVHQDGVVGGYLTRGYYTVSRWAEDDDGFPALTGESVQYYVENGRIATRIQYSSPGSYRQTWWDTEGIITSQRWVENGATRETMEKPPWLWGERDDASPQDPRWKPAKS